MSLDKDLHQDNTASEELNQLAKLRRFLDENSDLDKIVEGINAWENNELKQAQNGEKKAWRFAYGLGGLLGLSLISISVMMPLKKIMPPAVVVLDKSTGETFPLQQADTVQIPLDSAYAKKSVNDFLLARENYTYDTAYLNYEVAGAYMDPALKAQWENYWDDNNPQSPFKVYKKNVKVRTEINSIRLSPNKDGTLAVATVDYQRIVTKDTQKLPPERWIATITYKFGNVPIAEREFRINPFGFQVTDYQRDPFVASTPFRVPAATNPSADSGPTTGLAPAPKTSAAPQALVAPKLHPENEESGQ